MGHRYYISQLSIQELEELGFEIGDDREDQENVAKIQKKYILSILTKRQKAVARLLDDGYSRKEIAGDLHVCVQAVHQIVIRIRKRLKEKVNVSTYPDPQLNDYSRELILILMITYPGLKSESIFKWWHFHPALKDYPRPSITQIKKIMGKIYE
jgi:hypothetical protein